MNNNKSGRLHSYCCKRKYTIFVSFLALRTYVCVLAAEFVVRNKESHRREEAHTTFYSVLSLIFTFSLCSLNQCKPEFLK